MNWRRAGVAALFAVPLLVLLVMSMGRNPRIIQSPLIGRQAPDFALPVLESEVLMTTEGDTVRLSDYLGDVVVVNFWASWCPPCIQEHPALVQAAATYRDRGVHFIGVLYNDSGENARRWLDRLGEAYPTGLDKGTHVAIEYGVGSIPETYFIGRDGRVAYKHYGPLTPSELQRRIEEVLALPISASEMGAAAGAGAGSSEGP